MTMLRNSVLVALLLTSSVYMGGCAWNSTDRSDVKPPQDRTTESTSSSWGRAKDSSVLPSGVNPKAREIERSLGVD